MTTESKGILAIIYPAAFTLLGVAITAGIGWISAMQTASINYRQTCITRIDNKESTIRSKTEAFFSAQGGLVSLAAHRSFDSAEVEKLVDEATRAGYALSSYLDGELAMNTQSIAMDIGTRLDPKTESPTKEQTDKYIKTLTDWNSQYFKLLQALESARSDC